MKDKEFIQDKNFAPKQNERDCPMTSFELPLSFEQAEAYRKANGQYVRKNQWRDTIVRVLIDLN